MSEQPSRVYSNVLCFETDGAAVAYVTEHAELEAEVARLRTALERIATPANEMDDHRVKDDARLPYEIAREALRSQAGQTDG